MQRSHAMKRKQKNQTIKIAKTDQDRHILLKMKLREQLTE